MDIKDFFSGMFSSKPKNVLQTPYGNFNLAKGKDIKRVQKMVIDLQRTTDALTRKDIKNWRDAWMHSPGRTSRTGAMPGSMPSMWTVPAASACTTSTGTRK